MIDEREQTGPDAYEFRLPRQLPGFERSSFLSCHGMQVEIFFANSMHKLDALNCRSSASKALQAEDGI